MFKALTVMVLLAAAGLGGAWLHDPALVRHWQAQATMAVDATLPTRVPETPRWRLAELERGDIVATVAATGTLRPVATIGVPATATGQIIELAVDFNDAVVEGQPIALIDTALLEIAVEMAEADLDVARASLETQQYVIRRAEAALDGARSDLRAIEANVAAVTLQVRDAETDTRRRQALATTLSAAELERSISAQEVAEIQLRAVQAQADGRRALVRMAEADVAAGRSQLTNLQAVERQRVAALRQTRLELERSVVRAPVSGIVIGRDAEVGQTVGDGMPLFTIAQDLRDMQVNALIDEAEIGRVTAGQRVEFTVDAHRGRVFLGQVDQIRTTPQTQQNVVTYTVVVRTANPDLLLLPGMTASARFILDEARDVLIAPNAALRFTPPDTEALSSLHIWIERGNGLRPIPVQRGLIDEARSEITGPGLEAGMRVVIGIERRTEHGTTGRTLLGGVR